MAVGSLRSFAALLLLVPAMSGCVDELEGYYEFDPDGLYYNPGVFQGTYQASAGQGSTVLLPGPLVPGIPEVVRLKSELPHYPEAGGQETEEGEVLIPMAIWKPLNWTEKMPVIVDAGPYFENGKHCPGPPRDPSQPCPVPLRNNTIDHPQQSTPFSLKNFLPWGYAVVQLAVRGTGTHGGCMDLMGPAEQHDLNQAITWLGEQPWSNGHVAMMGASYDGSTPWEVAATGNPYLKVIVPVSGLPDIYDLMFHNGSSEYRGAIMHSTVYWHSYGFSPDWPDRMIPGSPVPIPLPVDRPTIGGLGNANGRSDNQNLQSLLCPEAYEGSAMGPATTYTGDRFADASTYWTERDHRQGVLDNYEGAVFLIHGLQDWNVDPHSAIPFNAALRDKGLPMKEWYGQWGHSYPDSVCPLSAPEWITAPCRLDYAEVLLRFLMTHMMDEETDPIRHLYVSLLDKFLDQDLDVGPSIQVQDNLGFWRNAASYPPTDANWVEFHLNGDGSLSNEGGAEQEVMLTPPRSGGPSEILEFSTDYFTDDVYISGLPQVKLPFEPLGEGGEIAVWLLDEDANGTVRAPSFAAPNPFQPLWRPAGTPVVGHAQMNLRYHEGGETMQPLVPGNRYTAQIEMDPLEVRVARGHRLTLWVFQYAYEDHQAASPYKVMHHPTPGPVNVFLGEDAVLRLPTLNLDPQTVFPVPGAHFPNRTLIERMHIEKPLFTGGLPVETPPPPMPVADASASGTAGGAAVATATKACQTGTMPTLHVLRAASGCTTA